MNEGVSLLPAFNLEPVGEPQFLPESVMSFKSVFLSGRGLLPVRKESRIAAHVSAGCNSRQVAS